MLSRQYEKQRIFLKEKRTFEPDSFLPQATRKYIYERTPYSLCSLDQTTHFLLAAWNTRRSHQKQTRAHGRKCALTTATHHAQAAGETASMHENGSNPPRALSKGCSICFRPLFAFFIIQLKSRKVIHVNMARSPTDPWVARTSAGGNSVWANASISDSG